MVNTWKDEIFINTETNIIIPIVIIAPIFINLGNQNGCKYYVNHNKNFKTYQEIQNTNQAMYNPIVEHSNQIKSLPNSQTCSTKKDTSLCDAKG